MNHQGTCCPIVELRQYTVHPGARDTLIELFDREFVETQEAEGATIIGQFRNLDDPNQFVWLRGFPDMPTRQKALTAFYGGPAWKAHSTAANATMVDVDNVLLLRPAGPGSGFALDHGARPPRGAPHVGQELVIATICQLAATDGDGFLDFFRQTLQRPLADTGASIAGVFVTEPSANNFPALPVREGVTVGVWFSSFRDAAQYEGHLATRAQSERWTDASATLVRRLTGEPQVLRLSPTTRSLLR